MRDNSCCESSECLNSVWHSLICDVVILSRQDPEYRDQMKDCRKFYINNQWVAPLISNDWAVENPDYQVIFDVFAKACIERKK